MLAKIAPRFVINRVIQTAYYADYMAVELAKEIIEEQPKTFYSKDPKKYFVMSFQGRNATFMAICLPFQLLLSLPISSRKRNTLKRSKLLRPTMMLEL